MAHHLAELGVAARVASAGVIEGRRAIHPSTCRVLADRGIEPPKTHSDQLSAAHGDSVDLILTMTGDHALTVGWRLRPMLSRVFTIDHFSSVVARLDTSGSPELWLGHVWSTPRSYPNQPGTVDIADPMGQDYPVFEAVGEQLWSLTKNIATALA